MFFLLENFLPNIQNLGLKIPHFGRFTVNITYVKLCTQTNLLSELSLRGRLAWTALPTELRIISCKARSTDVSRLTISTSQFRWVVGCNHCGCFYCNRPVLSRSINICVAYCTALLGSLYNWCTKNALLLLSLRLKFWDHCNFLPSKLFNARRRRQKRCLSLVVRAITWCVGLRSVTTMSPVTRHTATRFGYSSWPSCLPHAPKWNLKTPSRSNTCHKHLHNQSFIHTNPPSFV